MKTIKIASVAVAALVSIGGAVALARLYPFEGKIVYFRGCDHRFALYLQGYDF